MHVPRSGRPPVAGCPRLAASLGLLCAVACGGQGGGQTGPQPAAAPLPSCSDGRKDGYESDVDCGGPTCARCPTGHACFDDSDCASAVCVDTCLAPACDDGARNGDETDLDCGGPCAPCADGRACIRAGDCQSGTCTARSCAAITCTDGIRNGAETDVDCGGPRCPACALGRLCLVGSDCDRALCASLRCALAPSCLALGAAHPSLPSGNYPLAPAGTSDTVTTTCDMQTDGGGWTLLFHHDVSGGYFAYDGESLRAHPDDPTAKHFSLLAWTASFQRAGHYLFRIDWPGHPVRNIWQQATDPTEDVNVAGYVPLDIQANSFFWGGLELGNGSHGPDNGGAAFLDGSVNVGYWYYAIGSTRPYGRPPGIPAAQEVSPVSEGVPEARLWVR